MQLKSRSGAHSTAPAPGGTAAGARGAGTTTTSRPGTASVRPADPSRLPAPSPTTTFTVLQTPAQEQVVDERGTVLGVWDRGTGLGWVPGTDRLEGDGVDWFLACVHGRRPLDADARAALAEVRAMDYR